MRTSRLAALVLGPTLMLGACAGGPMAHNEHASEITRLQKECDQRGGILIPSGASTSQESLDNVCRVPNSASPTKP